PHAHPAHTPLTGAAHLEGAILVAPGSSGPPPLSREQKLLGRQVGVAYIIVFLNKFDMVVDEALLVLVAMVVRELVCKYDVRCDDTP
ncbi:GTP-binding protein, partial [Salmonella enterica subsp. enterica serovar Infantis]